MGNISQPAFNQSIESAPLCFAGAATTNFAQAVELSVVESPTYPITVSFMECFIGAVNAANPTIELGIYTWDGAGGGTLLASGTVIPTVAGWWQVTLSSPVTLSPRTKYYMAFLNRKSGDATTTVGTAGNNTISILQCAILNAQATMPSTLSGLSTSSASRMVLRAWT